MQYLKDKQHYEDRYDLITINICLGRIRIFKEVFAKVDKEKKFDSYTQEEKENSMNQFIHQELLALTLHRYKEREKDLEEWYEKDRKLQDLQDNTPTPLLKCKKCKVKMRELHRHLIDEYEKEPRVLFMLECPKCEKRIAIYENGEEWDYEPPKCKKCAGELQHDYKSKNEITTITTTCSSCDFKEVKKDNHKEFRVKIEQEEKDDKEKLEKYREKFCLSKDEGEKLAQTFEEMAFANEVYEYELQKYGDDAYEKAENISRLTVSKLKDLLNPELEKNQYSQVQLKEPNIGEFVEVEFSVEDLDNTRTKQSSEYTLRNLVKNILNTTNWRLMSNDVHYRLGYLSGALKGYEREDDILKLLGKKEEKPKIVLDPVKLEKYGHSNAVGLARLTAVFKGKERIREKKFKDYPDGFLLNEEEDSYYTCKICNSATRSSSTWWTPDGLTCTNCHNNIIKGVIPKDILGNEKIWFRSYDITNQCKVHPATVRKYIRKGELIGTPLKDGQGKEYFTVFLTKNNKEFFSKHVPVENRVQRWNFVDENGEVVWL